MTPAAADPVLSMSGVTLRRSERRILGPLDWTVEEGERWVIMGPNGSAKTSLVRLAAVREHPTDGALVAWGERLGSFDARRLRRRIGFVCPTLIRGVRQNLTALEFVMSARRGALDVWWHEYHREDVEAATRSLASVGVADRRGSPLSTLSTGESQRVQLARALVADPHLLVLDEPSAGLDIGGREDLVELIDHRVPPALPVILVTHHAEEIPRSITHCLVLSAGAVVAAGPIADALSSESLSEAFGLSLHVERRSGRWTARA